MSVRTLTSTPKLSVVVHLHLYSFTYKVNCTQNIMSVPNTVYFSGSFEAIKVETYFGHLQHYSSPPQTTFCGIQIRRVGPDDRLPLRHSDFNKTQQSMDEQIGGYAAIQL
ncbi:hypothetical protein ACTXT7_009123 [Hymenolepis weldensis]